MKHSTQDMFSCSSVRIDRSISLYLSMTTYMSRQPRWCRGRGFWDSLSLYVIDTIRLILFDHSCRGVVCRKGEEVIMISCCKNFYEKSGGVHAYMLRNERPAAMHGWHRVLMLIELIGLTWRVLKKQKCWALFEGHFLCAEQFWSCLSLFSEKCQLSIGISV